MVVPVPSYSDIGKAAKDLLGKDYPVGSAKMEFSTTSASGVVIYFC
jgi:voltage-dependent anion channel protein 2